MRVRIFAAALVVVAGTLCGTANAEPASATNGAAAAQQESYLDAFNENMHAFNLWMWREWRRLKPSSPLPTAAPDSGDVAPKVLANLINEPTSAVSWLIAGDYHNAGLSAWRFWVNTTQGWFGAVDVAAGQGVKPPSIDIGLALCARGVGEGGYVVLPIVGPRTVRDGLSDFIFTNAVTYALLSPLIGFPPSLETFAFVEVAEEAGRIAVIRQIDSADEKQRGLQEVRDEYLKSRRERCAALEKHLNDRAPQ